MKKHQIVVVGGGTAGITVSARLLNENPDLDIAIIEPSKKHYYQPMWTMVGGGIFSREESERDEEDLIPAGASWIQDYVESFDPENNQLTLRSGECIGYEFLVVAPGIQLNWDQISGLSESLGKNGVCSNYSYQTVPSTWKFIREFKGGNALFTQPSGAVKCGGAPQKIMYLAEDHFRKSGIRDRCEVRFASPGDTIFAVPKYAKTLERVIERKGIETSFGYELIEVRPNSRQAVFQTSDGEATLDYDLLHVTPPMGPPNFVANSPLASAEGGWVDVDKHTLQHVRYNNVFGIGDASNLPTSKTGAAIRKQAPVVVDNLLASLKGDLLDAEYDGYTSCPVVTGYNSLVLAEFDYDKKPAETFPFDQGKERFSMFLLKKLGLPALYWHGMLRGRA